MLADLEIVDEISTKMEKTDKTLKHDNERAIARIESFSDSVFGFAITLLVMDILQIPRPEMGESFLQSMLHHWQPFFSFLVGFCTILVCWINHHHMFSHIERYNTNLMWINGFLLMIVTFTPLPTAILADFLMNENHVGVIVFGFTYFLIASLYDRVWTYACNHKLLDANSEREYYLSIKMTYRCASIYTFIVFFICFLSTPVAIALYAIMFLVFAFPKTFALMLQKHVNFSNK